MKKLALLLLNLILFIGIISAQELQVVKPIQNCLIKGTSTMHDWELNISQINGKIEVTKTDGKIPQINNLMITIPVVGLKSSKSTMTEKTYELLKKDKYPIIKLESNSITLNPAGSDYRATVQATITVAGQSRNKTIASIVKLHPDGKVTTTGSFTLLLTEFGLEPPKMFLGALKTGDQVTIQYEIHFK